MNTEQRNKALIGEMLDTIAKEGIAAHTGFFARHVINHGLRVSRDDIQMVLDDIAGTFPDARFEPAQTIAEGEWVALRGFLTGTHLGMGRHPYVHEGLLAGVAPTGKSLKVQRIHMFRIVDGAIVEHWACRDDMDMMRQLGLMLPVTAQV